MARCLGTCIVLMCALLVAPANSLAQTSRELFHIRTDPQEQHNLADSRPEIAERLNRFLHERSGAAPVMGPACPNGPARNGRPR